LKKEKICILNLYVYLKYKVWVQCENGSCLKWRLLSSDDAAQVNPYEPWYCYMNTDPWFNNCSTSEEHFPEESQFRKNGFKYVYSELPLGSLVLARTCNWPRWPGILCPDPINGQHVTYDLDGDGKNNHVEFLGKPHSRGWVAVKDISHYPSSMKPEECKRKKKWYESALEEANKLLAFPDRQRLEMCYLSKMVKKIIFTNKFVPTLFHKMGARGKIPLLIKITFSNVISLYMITDLQQLCQSVCRKSVFRCSLETVVSDDILSKENLGMYKHLEQCFIWLQVAISLGSYWDSQVIKLSVTKCSIEITEESSVENCTQEDCIIIDGIAFRTGECIENITDKFKEIDSLMAELQDSL
uniref:Zinc finger CW-type and PWWP domain containing 2 n=1 Tax=Sphenodon punctatus TaxID=8508 RepID=A0A8D0HPP1_SPHPU